MSDEAREAARKARARLFEVDDGRTSAEILADDSLWGFIDPQRSEGRRMRAESKGGDQ